MMKKRKNNFSIIASFPTTTVFTVLRDLDDYTDPLPLLPMIIIIIYFTSQSCLRPSKKKREKNKHAIEVSTQV